MRFLEGAGQRDTGAIVIALDAAAARTQPTVTGEAALVEYSKLLERGEPASRTRVRADGNVELMVPLELALAWRTDAAHAGEEIEQWAGALLADSAAEAVDAIAWEAAAALSGRRLTEWVYACALCWETSADSATPHWRT